VREDREKGIESEGRMIERKGREKIEREKGGGRERIESEKGERIDKEGVRGG